MMTVVFINSCARQKKISSLGRVANVGIFSHGYVYTSNLRREKKDQRYMIVMASLFSDGIFRLCIVYIIKQSFPRTHKSFSELVSFVTFFYSGKILFNKIQFSLGSAYWCFMFKLLC